MKRLLLRFVLAFSAAAPHVAAALESDRDRPINVNAAAVHLDEKSGVAVYRGNVVLVQGSLRLEADRMEVRTQKRKAQVITATGTPARLRARLDDREKELHARARRIVYDTAAREVVMSGDVYVNQGGDVFSAESARYALDAQRLEAEGGRDGRVHAVLEPRTDETP